MDDYSQRSGWNTAWRYLIRRLDAETFRPVCMSFDAWVVG
jgi:hypothetical protein